MLTMNFWKLFTPLVNRLNGSTANVTVTLPDGTTLTDTVYGTSVKPYNMLGAICIPYANEKYGTSFGTWFGKGRTPATVEDYTMEAPITDGSLTITSGKAALSGAINGDHVRISAAHHVTNNTAEDIIVSEIGSFGNFASAGKPFMLDHTVLEEPITIPAKDTITLEYTIKFPFGN